MRGLLSRSNNGIVVSAFVLALIVDLTGCSRSQKEQPTSQTPLAADVAPGTLSIDILGADPEHYWQYEVRPTIGLVRKVKEQNTDEDMPHVFSQPAGAIQSCGGSRPEVSSLDGKYLAYCTGSRSEEFFVLDKKTNVMLYHWKPEEWRGIRGFVWAPNSHSVALLNISERYGKNPLEIFSALTGHPVPHDTIYLDVLDPRIGKVTGYIVRSNVVSAFTRILNWSE
jgi:hypothetical protein